MARIYIIAGNYAQAHTYAFSAGMKQSDWSYIDNPRKLLGLPHDTEIKFCGTYVDRLDWREMNFLLKQRELLSLKKEPQEQE